MMNKANETVEPKEVTVHELVAAFEGKYVDIISDDRYGITIDMTRATLECEDDKPELWLVSRDDQNRVTGTVCIDEDSIENIEQYEDGSYLINFSLCMTSVSISEYKSLEELQKEHARKNLKVVK